MNGQLSSSDGQSQPLRLGTRRSGLAMAQSGMVARTVGRVTGRPVELVELHGQAVGPSHTIGVELSQPELGRLIGAGTDAVGRAMHRLKAAGLVRSQYRSVTVLDLAALHRRSARPRADRDRRRRRRAPRRSSGAPGGGSPLA
ncbi:helix-turn-helix domain-containing protein, partial [Kitasatospora nipponensis]|uniref:helix-turn-helix domain-containing protein n=1 Tax=Kitasatospora nipponensis TaxID=258049 RepID=UPI0031E25AB4